MATEVKRSIVLWWVLVSFVCVVAFILMRYVGGHMDNTPVSYFEGRIDERIEETVLATQPHELTHEIMSVILSIDCEEYADTSNKEMFCVYTDGVQNAHVLYDITNPLDPQVIEIVTL